MKIMEDGFVPYPRWRTTKPSKLQASDVPKDSALRTACCREGKERGAARLHVALLGETISAL